MDKGNLERRFKTPNLAVQAEAKMGGDSENMQGEEDAISMETNVATVHSDDYDLPVAEHQRESSLHLRQLPDMQIGSIQESIEMGSHGIQSYDPAHAGSVFTMPSVSSASAEASSDTRAVIPSQRLHRVKRGARGYRIPAESDLVSKSSAWKGSMVNREAARMDLDRK